VTGVQTCALPILYNQELITSRNNLRAIIPSLNALGGTYAPQYLTADAFNAIIGSPMETFPAPLLYVPLTPVPTQAPLPVFTQAPAPVPTGLIMPALTTIPSVASYAGLVTPNVAKIVAQFQAIPATPLSATETSDIIYLQGAQKLQRDLYSYMVEQNNANPIFSNLAQSADAILTADNAILTKYNLPLPTVTAPGTFSDPKLQNLYVYLTGQSGGTTPDQLNTAAMSEEIHISDISAALSHTDNADLKSIYNQELAFSRNNLRAIIPLLSTYGQSYIPQYLSQDTINSIVSGPMESVPGS
jgi:hypothetical protein